MEIKEFTHLRKLALSEEGKKQKKIPTLCIISAGDNPANESYIRGKNKDIAEVGFKSINLHFPNEVKMEELIKVIDEENHNPEVDGILVQLPIPKGLDYKKLQSLIDPKKDVDGFSPVSPFVCCTPKGIVEYLEEEGLPFEGKNAVVLGRSDIVGKPMAKLLLSKNCNVTVLHSKTSPEDRHFYLSHADLIVIAIGIEGYLDKTYELKKTAVIVDVGINRGEDGHLHGDAVPGLQVRLQTPVPGGVGLLTRVALLENLLEATRL